MIRHFFFKHRIYYNDFLPEEQARKIFRQIISGYQELFQKNIVHRNLTPYSILLSSDEIVQIVGFSYAKIKENNNQLQKMHALVGVPVYIAPEVWQNDYTNKVDVWSLGVTFYRVLFGKLPWNLNELENFYELDRLREIYQYIRAQPLNFELQPLVSNEMKNIINRMLTIEEENRMSCEELITLKI